MAALRALCYGASPPSRGTTGYTDPEYAATGKMTPNSDIFAVGMVIL